MYSKIICSALFTLLSFQTVIGQSGVQKMADKYFNNYAFATAIPLYEQLATDSQSAVIPETFLKLADCYKMVHRYEDAEQTYRLGLDSASVNPDLKLRFAQTLQINGKFDEALQWYSIYQKEKPNDPRGTHGIFACKELLNTNKADDEFAITPHLLNSEWNEMSPIYFEDGILFNSSRVNTELSEKEEDAWSGEAFLDIYYHPLNGDSSIVFPEIINSAFHEGPMSWDTSGTLYFTRTTQFGKRKKTMGLGIYQTQKTEAGWTNPILIEIPGISNSFMHPAFDPITQRLYFAAIHPEGFGGFDICWAEKIGESWSNLTLMDSTINTPGDEMYPYLDSEENLWFSSDGLPGYGGLDIFKVDETGNVNVLPLPLNSNQDDFGINWKAGGMGLMTSNRKGGLGGDDIYEVYHTKTIPISGLLLDQFENPINNHIVSLRLADSSIIELITDSTGRFEAKIKAWTAHKFEASADDYTSASMLWSAENEQEAKANPPVLKLEYQYLEFSPIVSSENEEVHSELTSIDVINLDDNSVQTIEPDSSGNFNIRLLKGPEYEFRASQEDHLPISERVKTEDIPDGTNTRLKLNMVKIEDGLVMELSNVFYDFAVWELRQESIVSLELLISILNKYPYMKIEIASHTDARATAPHNMRLSQKRSENVKTYLVKSGIEFSRVSALGYGETRLRNGCIDGVECTEEEHQYNRRTEFKVISH